jgi:hypothetical protein
MVNDLAGDLHGRPAPLSLADADMRAYQALAVALLLHACVEEVREETQRWDHVRALERLAEWLRSEDALFWLDVLGVPSGAQAGVIEVLLQRAERGEGKALGTILSAASSEGEPEADAGA